MGADGGSSTSSSSTASSEVTTKGIQDQKALGKAIMEYEQRHPIGGGGAGTPGGYFPPY